MFTPHRVQLESWLPKEYWDKINLLWVGFGQETQQQKEKSLKKVSERESRRTSGYERHKIDFVPLRYRFTPRAPNYTRRQALACSNPQLALKLMKRVGLDYVTEGKRYGLEDEIKAARTK